MPGSDRDTDHEEPAMTETMSPYSRVFDLAGAYTDEAWGLVNGHHWDRLAAIAGEFQRGERTEADMLALVEDTVADVKREAATMLALDGKTNVAADAPVTPLDVLVGDVVLTDGMTIVVDHIITWDVQPRGFNPDRRVAACNGTIVATFPGGPTGRWNVQGNDLRHLSTVYR